MLVLRAGIEVKSHWNNVCDVIIVHMISEDAQTNKQTNKQRDAENIKQS